MMQRWLPVGSGAASRPILLAVTVLLGTLIAAGCGLAPSAGPAVCDGISSELGGCDPDRATFVATECATIADEFGRQLEAKVLQIVDGPESAEESKAVRVGAVTVVTASLANRHIRRQGLIRECDAETFVADAETAFSERFRSTIGGYLHDGPVVDYQTWRSTLVTKLGILDVEEDAPVPS